MQIAVTKTQTSRLSSIPPEKLEFGKLFSDHMLSMRYENNRWGQCEIVPYGDLLMKPSNATLHYGQAVFEGMKAFYQLRGRNEGKTIIFRPDKHIVRFNRSAERLCIPTLDPDLFLEGICQLIRLDQSWVPKKRGLSLYIRPIIFAADEYLGVRPATTFRFITMTCPVGGYYETGPVKLMTPGEFARAFKGGVGEAKTPANYAASLYPASLAKKQGFSQVLWLDAFENKYIDEVGTMNVFFVINHELITPALNGSVLSGVTRETVLSLAREWKIPTMERPISIDEVLEASKRGTLNEAFGSGTAAVISPIAEIVHQNQRCFLGQGEMGAIAKRLYTEITGIQYGDIEDRHGWCHSIQ